MPRRSEEFGARLRHLREEHGLSQAEAAQRMGVSQQYWSQWERGTIPAREQFEKLVGIFGLRRREWLGLTGYQDYLDLGVRFSYSLDGAVDREFTLTIHQLQRDRGMTDEEAAEAVNISLSDWQLLRRGWLPDPDVVPHIADALAASAPARYVLMDASGLTPGAMGLTGDEAAAMPITLGEVLRAVQSLSEKVEELRDEVSELRKAGAK